MSDFMEDFGHPFYIFFRGVGLLLVATAREMLSSVWTKWAAGEILIHCLEKEGVPSARPTKEEGREKSALSKQSVSASPFSAQ